MSSALKEGTQLTPTANGQRQPQIGRFKPESDPNNDVARGVAPFKRRVQREFSLLIDRGKKEAVEKASRFAPGMIEEIGHLLAGGKNFEQATLEALATVYKNERIIIYPHRNPDADAISSAAALKERFHRADIIIDGKIPHETHTLIKQFGIQVIYAAKIKGAGLELLPGDYAGAIVLDTGTKGRVPELPDSLPLLAVINHRGRARPKDVLNESDEGLNPVFVDINNTRFGATAEIIATYLPPKTERAARLLLIGIYTDTSFQTRKVSDATYRVCSEMMKNFGIAYKSIPPFIIGPKFSSEELVGMARTLGIDKNHIRVIRGSDRKKGKDLVIVFREHPVADDEQMIRLCESLLDVSHLALVSAPQNNGDQQNRFLMKRQQYLPGEWERIVNCLDIITEVKMKLKGGSGGGQKYGTGGFFRARAETITDAVVSYLKEAQAKRHQKPGA